MAKKAKDPILDAEVEQQTAAGEETTSQRAQRIARENVAKKAKEAKARKDAALASVDKLSADYMKSVRSVPYQDRDGKIVPFLIVGGEDTFKKEANGDHVIDPKTRELMPEYQLKGWLFSAADGVIRQTVYKAPDSLKED